MFHLYEDPMTSGGMASINNINWEEFGRFDVKDLEGGGDDVVVKKEPEGSPEKTTEDSETGKEKAA
jgi:hypothetical protein